jgi:hypothetical protein
MKKIAAAFAALLMLAACSDDDNTAPGNNSPLVKTEQISYSDEGEEYLNIFEYSSGKPVKYSFYTPDDALSQYAEYDYSNGLLASVTGFSGSNEQTYSLEYSYDSSDRLVAIVYETESGEFDYTVTYTHNADNTIDYQRTGSNPEMKTFFLNSAGYIYKEMSDDGTYELTFSGPNPIYGTSNGVSVTTFEYDQVHDPSLLQLEGGFGNFIANGVLRSQHLSDGRFSTADKYVLKSINPGWSTENVYTFNEAGLPLKLKKYSNDVLVSETDYFYE